MSVDISDLGLGDRVYCKEHGFGKVIECTEKPTVKVKFTEWAKPVIFNQKKADQYRLEME